MQSNVYDQWSGVFEGRCDSLSEMREMLEQGRRMDAPWTYCFIGCEDACWWLRGMNGYHRLANNRGKLDSDIGLFVKRVRYGVVKSGGSLERLVYYLTDERISDFVDGGSARGLFKGVSGIADDIVGSLSMSDEQRGGSEGYAYSIKRGWRALGVSECDGFLHIGATFYRKDWSSYSAGNLSASALGVALDCEGVSGSDGDLKNGCGEVGGVVFCKHKGSIYSKFHFVADQQNFGSVMRKVAKQYGRGLTLYVYGSSDRIMLEAQMKLSHVKASFAYTDVKGMFRKYYDSTEGRLTMQNIADGIGAYVVRPKHSALADARTLFNMLRVLYERGEFLN